MLAGIVLNRLTLTCLDCSPILAHTAVEMNTETAKRRNSQKTLRKSASLCRKAWYQDKAARMLLRVYNATINRVNCRFLHGHLHLPVCFLHIENPG